MTDTDWKGIAEGVGDVGGRSVEVDQIVASLADRVRAEFPVNRAPADIVEHLQKAGHYAALLYAEIKAVGALVLHDTDGDDIPEMGPEEHARVCQYIKELVRLRADLDEARALALRASRSGWVRPKLAEDLGEAISRWEAEERAEDEAEEKRVATGRFVDTEDR